MSAVGSPVLLTGRFYDDAGNPADPTSGVTYTVTLPDATTTTAAATSTETGVWTHTYTPAVAGQYQFYFTGTGTHAAVTDPDVFTVEPVTTTALVSLADVKRQLNKTGTGDDAALLDYIRSATDIINSCEGFSAPTQFVETVTASVDAMGRQVLMVSNVPVLSVQSITPRMVGLPSVAIDTLNINPNSGVLYLGNWFMWFGPQLVTYTAGRTSVPRVLQDACALLVQWLWETRRGGATSTPNSGGQEIVTYKTIPMPERVATLLAMHSGSAAPGIA